MINERDQDALSNGSPGPGAGAKFRSVVLALALLAILMILFRDPLLGLFALGREENLYSHLLLIPGVIAYLVFIYRDRVPSLFTMSPAYAGMFAILGAVALVGQISFVRPMSGLPPEDVMCLPILAFVFFSLAIGVLCFGSGTLRLFALPAASLFLMVPIPAFVVHPASVFLQYASSEMFHWLLLLSGTPVYREGLTFHLSGLDLEVALECSGIRSTVVLIVTSVLAGYMFLDQHWKRILLVVISVPIGIVRNGIRIFSIGLLTIHVDDGVIQGPLHSRGGPLFFAMSLGFLFLLIFVLRRIGSRPRGAKSAAESSTSKAG